MESYFTSYKLPIHIIHYNDRKKHLSYCSPAYEDDDIWTKINRKKYVSNVNKWLNYDYIDIDIFYDKQENIQHTNEYKQPLVKDVCKKMYDDVLNVIQDAGFEINDINQFKEDFIHYMYILSDNRRP